MPQTNAAQAANEDTSDLPPPSHRHPMSGEPIWDQHAVRAMLSKLRAPVADERALPPMPKPAVLWHSDFTNQTYYGYTADHMRAYARTALASAPVAGEARPVIHQHGFAADNQRLRAINESLDKQLEEVMTERDEYHDMADKLANAIADHLLVEIGEHSSSNCPWMRALDAIENAAPQATAEDVRNAALEEAAQVAELTVAGNAKPGTPYAPGTAKQAAARIRALKSPTIATEAHQISQLRSTVEDLKKLFRQERGRCGEIRNATLEEAAELADGCDKRATPRGIACAIRAIKSTPAPTAVEGANDVALPPCPQALVKVEGMPRYLWPEMQAYARAAVLADRQRRSGDAPREDDMLTIAYLAGAQAEKERAALSAQPGAIRNPLIAEPSGNPGELDCAALSARKEGDARASATQAEQGERDAG
ncbi:hypothetical protein AB4067_07110 [Bordetella bronchiseptica]